MHIHIYIYIYIVYVYKAYYLERFVSFYAKTDNKSKYYKA